MSRRTVASIIPKGEEAPRNDGFPSVVTKVKKPDPCVVRMTLIVPVTRADMYGQSHPYEQIQFLRLALAS